MTVIWVAALLSVSPGVRLADSVASRHHAGVRLVSAADDLPPEVVAELSAAELQGVLKKLRDTRPTYIVPTAFFVPGLVGGGVLGWLAYSIWTAGLATGNLATAFLSVVLASLVAVVAVGCGVLVLVGAIHFVVRGIQISRHMEVENRVRTRLHDVEPRSPSTPPAPRSAPDSPAPSQANLVWPRQLQTVMTF